VTVGNRAMPSSTELNDIFAIEGGNVVIRGDAGIIDDMLQNKLEKVRSDERGWTTVCRHRDTNELWELSYPQSDLHGGGPRRLRMIKGGL